jgi:uncharacterized protein (TIGR03086 family)
MTTTTGFAVLDEARAILLAAVASVPPDGWNDPTPCDAWTVAQVLQHAALDQVVWARTLAGGPMPQENPFAPTGELGGDPAGYLGSALAASAAAWQALSGEKVPTPLPQGPMVPADAAAAAALDAAIHGWDIAIATGQPAQLTGELARALTPIAEAIVEPLRQHGAYAAARADNAGDDDTARLLHYLGRG